MTDIFLKTGSPEDFAFVRPGKWTLAIVWHLADGPRRFSQLRRAMGDVSQKTLTHALRDLERDGFVMRTQYAGIPTRVEYELTPVGMGLLGFTRTWMAFIIDHRDTIERTRAAFDADQRDHAPVALRRFG